MYSELCERLRDQRILRAEYRLSDAKVAQLAGHRLGVLMVDDPQESTASTVENIREWWSANLSKPPPGSCKLDGLGLRCGSQCRVIAA